VYTSGQTSGTATFTAPAPGSYVARAFPNNTYTLLIESAAFTVAATGAAISTDQSAYTTGATVTVTYSGLPGGIYDWIAIAAAGSANTSYQQYVYTNGQTSGTATFVVNTSGVYVARAFPNNGYDLAAESAMFTVCGDGGGLVCYVAHAGGDEEVPANASTATGAGIFMFETATRTLTYEVQHTVVGASAGHIHQQSPGVNGGVIVPFTLVGQGTSGSAVLTVAQADALAAGNLYTNIHSPTYPGGEVRGQILRPGEILFVANLNQAQEVPPTGSTATGVGSVIYDPATDGIRWQLTHNVPDTTAAHIHEGAAGVNGNPIITLTGTSGTATLTSTQASGLLNAGLYMNIHSIWHPGGDIRGQLVRPGS
jgi:hypothetical protein